MTSADPTGLHDWHSDAYVQEWIGGQTEAERRVLLQRLVDLIPYDPDDEIRVLDIGGGYGALSKLVLDNYPHSTVVLHDYSEPMLQEARAHLAQYSDSVSYVRGDLMTSEWTGALTGEFNAVVSSIAIHNVRYPGRIKGVYQEVAPFVAKGGCFLNFDQVAAAGDLIAGAERHAGLMSRRRKIMEEERRQLTLAETAAEAAMGRRGRGGGASTLPSEAEPATLANQLKWLREGGYDQADCFWREGRRVIIGGYKSG